MRIKKKIKKIFKCILPDFIGMKNIIGFARVREIIFIFNFNEHGHM